MSTIIRAVICMPLQIYTQSIFSTINRAHCSVSETSTRSVRFASCVDNNTPTPTQTIQAPSDKSARTLQHQFVRMHPRNDPRARFYGSGMLLPFEMRLDVV